MATLTEAPLITPVNRFHWPAGLHCLEVRFSIGPPGDPGMERVAVPSGDTLNQTDAPLHSRNPNAHVPQSFLSFVKRKSAMNSTSPYLCSVPRAMSISFPSCRTISLSFGTQPS